MVAAMRIRGMIDWLRDRVPSYPPPLSELEMRVLFSISVILTEKILVRLMLG